MFQSKKKIFLNDLVAIMYQGEVVLGTVINISSNSTFDMFPWIQTGEQYFIEPEVIKAKKENVIITGVQLNSNRKLTEDSEG